MVPGFGEMFKAFTVITIFSNIFILRTLLVMCVIYLAPCLLCMHDSVGTTWTVCLWQAFAQSGTRWLLSPSPWQSSVRSHISTAHSVLRLSMIPSPFSGERWAPAAAFCVCASLWVTGIIFRSILYSYLLKCGREMLLALTVPWEGIRMAEAADSS